MKHLLFILAIATSLNVSAQICPTMDSIEVPTSSALIDMEVVGTDVWLLSDDTLLKYDGSNWTFIDANMANFPADVLIDITSDNNGDIWIYSIDTISKYDGSTITNVAFPDSIHTNANYTNEEIICDTLGNIWLFAVNDSTLLPFINQGMGYGWAADLIEFSNSSWISHFFTWTNSSSGSETYNLSLDKEMNYIYSHVDNGFGSQSTGTHSHNDGWLSNPGYINYAYSNADNSIGYGYGNVWMFGNQVNDCTWSTGGNPINNLIPINGFCSYYTGEQTTLKLFENKTLNYQDETFNFDFLVPIIDMKDDINGVGYVLLPNLLVKLTNNVISDIISLTTDTICLGDSSLVTSTIVTDSIRWSDFSQGGFSWSTSYGDIHIADTGWNHATIYANGCILKDSLNLAVLAPYNNEKICLVTVDSVTGYNKIAFEKTSAVRTKSINIYKESNQAGVYGIIATLPFDSLSEYVDTTSSPASISARYKISAVDSCGNESSLSTEHQTIHLASNIGVGGEVNLSWNAYEGFTYSTFDIYRGTNSSNMTLLTQVQSNLFSFTDQSPPSGNIHYQVVVTNPDGCTTNKKSGSYGSSVSNIIEINDNTTGVIESETISAKIYPNPANNILNVSGISLGIIIIYDVVGKVVFSEPISNRVDISEIPTGVYTVEIANAEFQKTEKLIIKR